MKVAVLGSGFMGTTHIAALRHLEGVEVVAVATGVPAGAAPAKLGNLGNAGNGPDLTGVRIYVNYEDAIADAEVEAVDICLPTNLHCDATIAALRAGRHVLVEKPMALYGRDCDAMIAEAEKAGRVLMTAQVLRFAAPYVALTEAIGKGALGTVRSAWFRRRCGAPAWSRWLTDPDQSGGAVLDMLIHDLDQCLDLFGWPAWISATGYVDVEKNIDTISADLFYPEMGSVTVAGGWYPPKEYPFAMEFSVSGDRGTADYRSADGKVRILNADGAAEAGGEAIDDMYQSEVAYFIECCRENRAPARCLPTESAAAVKLARSLLTARDLKGQWMSPDCPPNYAPRHNL